MALNSVKAFETRNSQDKQRLQPGARRRRKRPDRGSGLTCQCRPVIRCRNCAASPNIAIALSQSTDGGIFHGGGVGANGYTGTWKTFGAMTVTATAVPLPMLLL